MRNTTERPEALEAGTVKLVGTDYGKIREEVSALLDNSEYYNQMSLAVNPYGGWKSVRKDSPESDKDKIIRYCGNDS